MADEAYIVDFVSRVGSYEQGVEALVKAHARLTSEFDRTSKAGDRVEKQLLGLSGAMDKSSKGITTMSGATYANDKALQTASKQTALYNQYLFDQEKALNRSTQGLITQRYALYDVATTYGAIGAALLGASAYAIKVGADFERSFTNVERTLDQTGEAATLALGQIRAELVDLSTQIPLTFTELTEIATLGNQLGIASEDLIEFTRTVAQFSAVTGVTINETAQAFGSLGNIMGLTSDQFDNLGSAIALAGRRGVTTEAQILSLTREVAQQATDAGFAADQVVGLAAALGNLRLPPERSRGALTIYFQTLNSAVAEGGDKLQDFASIVGVTTGELEAMVRGGQGAEVFRRFIQSLESLDNVDTTAALDRLGLAQLRVSDVFQRLSGDISKYDKALADANEGFVEQAELAAQYALIADDLTSRFQELVNAVNALIDAATGGQISGLADLVQVLIDMTNAARYFISTDVGQVFTRLALGAALFVGALFAVRAAQALATASTYALITAQTSLAASSGLSGIKGLISTLLGYTTVVNGATVSTLTLTGAVKALAKATLILAAIDFAFRLITDFQGLSEEVDNATNGVFGLQDALDDMGTRMLKVGDLTVGVSDGMLHIGDAALSASDALLASTGPLATVIALWQAFNRETSGAGRRRTDGVRQSRGGSFGSNADDAAATAAAASATDDYAASLKRAGSAAGGAAREVRTLLDYASDLGSVIDRAFDIRFGSQAALDQITTSWMDLNEEIAEYQRKVQQLTADRAIKSYFLSVAEAYGDALRAGVLRSEIADIDAELADATANASTELTGNSRAAAINRKRITDLVAQYGDYIEALAAGGADQATLNAAVAQSRAEFLAQAQALGYSNAQLQPYIASFNDMAIAIARVPRNITVSANTNPALQALAELEARARSVTGANYGGINIPVRTSNSSLIASLTAQINAAIANMNRSGYSTAAANYIAQLSLARQQAINAGYAGGGYTGNGGKYEPKGVVHGGEFVFTKQATSNAGTGNLYAMMRALETGRGYALGGYVPAQVPVSGGAGMMGLSPQDRGILRGILDAVRTIEPGYLPDEVISRGAQRGDKVRQARGEI